MTEGDLVRVTCNVWCYTRSGAIVDKTFNKGAVFRIHTMFTIFGRQAAARLVSRDGKWISTRSIDANFFTPLSPLEQLAECSE